VGRPATCDLKHLLRAWLDFRFEVVTRSLQFRRQRLLQRIHILEGLARVLGALDAALKLIRAAQDRADARTKLEKKFSLDAAQADAVLEIMLYRLAQLEVQKVQDELAEKQKEVARIDKLLEGDQPRWELIQAELGALAERYGDKRRTAVRTGEGDEAQYDAAALVVREDVFVFLTREGRVKRTKSYEDPGKVRVREEDELLTVLQGSTVAPCAFFTNYGSAYVLPIHELPPTAGYGEPIQKHFNFKDGERVIGAASLDPRLVPLDPELALFAATAAGNVLRVPLPPHREPSTRAGRKLLKLGEGDEVVAVEVALEPRADALLCTSGGHALRAPLAEVPLLSAAGKGKRGVELGKGEAVIGATVGPALLLETTRGAREELSAKDISRSGLGGPGVEVKQRGGWRRVLPVPPAPRELPAWESPGSEGGPAPAAE
jgi:DNA gyrase subunit A